MQVVKDDSENYFSCCFKCTVGLFFDADKKKKSASVLVLISLHSENTEEQSSDVLLFKLNILIGHLKQGR